METLKETEILSNLSSLPDDKIIEIVKVKHSNDQINHIAGIFLMLANKMRRKVLGYTSARGFGFGDFDRAINYDLRVIKRWMDYLESYKKGASRIQNRNILELGPGADLGIGLITLAEGANSYHAMDVNNLIENTPKAFYDQLLRELKADPHLKADFNELKQQLELTQNGKNDRLNYICDPKFDLNQFKNKKIDLVVSNSAVQQFDDPEASIEVISKIVQPGGHFIALIDLKSLTRWIRDKDPLNIYRYSNAFYKQLIFRGSQNRFRPFEFKEMLESNGWKDVEIIPRIQLEKDYTKQVIPSLHPRFQGEENQMEILTCLICATKS